jgi:hypothetical protein
MGRIAGLHSTYQHSGENEYAPGSCTAACADGGSSPLIINRATVPILSMVISSP